VPSLDTSPRNNPTSPNQAELIRGLSLADTTALVIGTVIGTGVFMKAGVMSQYVGSPSLVLLAWVAAGLLSLAGALTYAELGAMMPKAGGEYVYLNKSFGEPIAFLFGWQRFIVAGSASIASLAVGLTIFLSSMIDLDSVWFRTSFPLLGQMIDWQFGIKQIIAVCLILVASAVNCLAVIVGGKINLLLTLLKIGGIAFIIAGVFSSSTTGSWANLAQPSGNAAWCGWSLFGMAMLSALWGYDGWNNMPMAAGEVRDPGRNIPRALVLGMIIVMAIYCSLNLSYFYALPFEQVRTSNSTDFPDALPIATNAAKSFLGDIGGRLASIVFIISALGALNGSILSNARVPFAMARDGLFFKPFGALSAKTRVPIFCLVAQGLWASVLAVSGTFDQLTDCLLFASWIFYGLVTSSVFVLRYKFPDLPRPYRTVGYPVVPLVFILVAIWLIYNTAVNKPILSLVGIVLTVIGLPLYAYFKLWGSAGSKTGLPRQDA
jgi:basic amino acid/polyamine antiporter, APA family